MKKVLLTLAALAAVSVANAQQTYNFFDPADCDADGWLWFDTQAKLEKYCGFEGSGQKYKVTLLSATFENNSGEYDEPTLEGDLKGYNAEGVQGGGGAWTGAISLCGSKNANGSDAPNGGGFIIQLPDYAEFSLALSTEASIMGVGLTGAKGWVPDIDCQVIQTYLKMGFINRPLATKSQFKWENIQNVENNATSFKLPTAPGEKVTVAVRNNRGDALLVQGIKLFTYTKTEYPEGGASVGEIGIDDANAPVEFFNMQGVRVSGDEPGLYIRRQGSKTSKIIVK